MIKQTEVNAVASNEQGLAFRISWLHDEKGFGNIDDFYSKNHGFSLETGAMSKDFVKSVLNAIVDSAKIRE